MSGIAASPRRWSDNVPQPPERNREVGYAEALPPLSPVNSFHDLANS